MDISSWTSGLFIPQRRSIGGIHAQVTIREQERDELQITEHPVEQGAPIADHAFKRPSEVQIRAGWSAAVAGNLGASGGVYGMLLSWQASLNPFDLYTGKRTYKHMLIQSLTVTTDSQSEFALMADIVCRQVIIVATKTGTAAQSPTQNPDNMKSPESNGGSSDQGSQKPRTVESNTNTSDYSGGALPSSAPAGEESLSVQEEGYLRDSGPSPPGPEGQKVETTIEKNDPTGDIRENKGTELRRDIGDDYLNDAPSPPGPKSVTLMPPSRLLLSKPKILIPLPNIMSLRRSQPRMRI